MRAADAHKLPAGGALAVDRHGFSAAVTAALEGASADRDRARRDRRPCRRRTGTASSSPPAPSPRRRWRRRSAALTGEDALAFFDAIAPIVHRRVHRFVVRLVPVALRQGGPGGDGADYINCPLDRAQYEAFIAALLAGEKTEFKEWEKSHALFRGLPADRSDGGTRARDAALRADEAGRPARSARTDSGPTPWCSCARTTRSARCGTWSASRPS